jgi:hypothetical protein
MEYKLMQLGFFRCEKNKETNHSEGQEFFKLFESYKNIFLRIIIKKEDNFFFVDHIYFHSSDADNLQVELFGNDLSVENILNSLKTYRDSVKLHATRNETE